MTLRETANGRSGVSRFPGPVTFLLPFAGVLDKRGCEDAMLDKLLHAPRPRQPETSRPALIGSKVSRCPVRAAA